MKKNKKFSIGEAFVANLKQVISEGKSPSLDKKTKMVIEKMVKEALEDELESYIETEDEMETSDSLDMMEDDFDTDLEAGEEGIADFQDYNIDLEQLDDADEVVINIDSDGNMKIDKIETAEGEEFTADELEASGVIEKIKKENKTKGAGKEDLNKRGKMSYHRDDSKGLANTELYKGGDVTSKMYENVNISGVDLTVDPESEAMVDEEGNVQFIDDMGEQDIISGSDIDLGSEDEISLNDEVDSDVDDFDTDDEVITDQPVPEDDDEPTDEEDYY